MIEKRKYLTNEEEEYLKLSIKNQVSSLKETLLKDGKIKKMDKVSIVKEGEYYVNE